MNGDQDEASFLFLRMNRQLITRQVEWAQLLGLLEIAMFHVVKLLQD